MRTDFLAPGNHFLPFENEFLSTGSSNFSFQYFFLLTKNVTEIFGKTSFKDETILLLVDTNFVQFF